MHPRNKRKNRFESKRTVQSDGEWEGVRWGARGNETEQRNASICSRTLNRASYSSVRFVLQFLNEKLIESIQIRSRHAWKGFPRKLHTEHPHKELALVSFQVAWKGDVARRPFLSPFSFNLFTLVFYFSPPLFFCFVLIHPFIFLVLFFTNIFLLITCLSNDTDWIFCTKQARNVGPASRPFAERWQSVSWV